MAHTHVSSESCFFTEVPEIHLFPQICVEGGFAVAPGSILDFVEICFKDKTLVYKYSTLQVVPPGDLGPPHRHRNVSNSGYKMIELEGLVQPSSPFY